MSPFYKKLIFICLSISIYLFCLIIWSHSSFQSDIFGNPEDDDHGDIRQHGDYYIWHNYIRAETEFKDNSSITLTTHGSYQDLAMLPMLVNRWQGPISLTLYACGEDYDKTIESLGYINRCTKIGHLLRRYVSIHLCFHKDYIPPSLVRISFWFTPSPFICSQKPLFVGTQSITFWFEHGLNYPINLLRNVARMNALTYFILPLNIELLPTSNFTMNFFKFLQNTWANRLPKESLFCMPTFKHNYESPLPCNKRQLLEVLRNTNITQASNYDDKVLQKLWLKSKNPMDRISIFSITEANDMCVGYVSVNTVEPLFDELFEYESIYYASHLKSFVFKYLKYKFIILDGTFLFRRDLDSWHDMKLFNHESISNNKIRLEFFQNWLKFSHYLSHN